jgi:integrase
MPYFTSRDIVGLPPGRYQLTGSKGLYLIVSEDEQVRRWVYRYTSPVTKRVTETGLGLFPAITIDDARDKAADLRKQVAHGICPINAKRAEHASKVIFREAAEGWIAARKPSWRSQSQERNARLLLFNHGHALCKMPVASITRDHVQRALEALRAKYPRQARRALAMIKCVLDFAKAKGMRTGDNPAEWKGCHEYLWGPQAKAHHGALLPRHYAALPYSQLPEFMRQLRRRQAYGRGALALEFLILTATRTGEVLGATWNEIDWGKQIWTLLPHRTKQGREHQVPLSDRAMQILTMQMQFANTDYVFTGYKRTRLADKTMASVLCTMGVTVTVHGFRSTFRNWAGAETMFQREMIEQCLAHQVGNAVELAYWSSDALAKRRVIMEAWADYCG